MKVTITSCYDDSLEDLIDKYEEALKQFGITTCLEDAEEEGEVLIILELRSLL